MTQRSCCWRRQPALRWPAATSRRPPFPPRSRRSQVSPKHHRHRCRQRAGSRRPDATCHAHHRAAARRHVLLPAASATRHRQRSSRCREPRQKRRQAGSGSRAGRCADSPSGSTWCLAPGVSDGGFRWALPQLRVAGPTPAAGAAAAGCRGRRCRTPPRPPEGALLTIMDTYLVNITDAAQPWIQRRRRRRVRCRTRSIIYSDMPGDNLLWTYERTFTFIFSSSGRFKTANPTRQRRCSALACTGAWARSTLGPWPPSGRCACTPRGIRNHPIHNKVGTLTALLALVLSHRLPVPGDSRSAWQASSLIGLIVFLRQQATAARYVGRDMQSHGCGTGHGST